MTGAPMTAAQKAAYAARVARAKAALTGDMGNLVRVLGLRGRRAGASFTGLPPHRESDNPHAFAVYLSGPKAGGWKDFVTGETGDVFKLVALVKGHASFKDTLAWTEARHGLINLPAEERQRLDATRAKDAARHDADEAAARAKKMQAACWHFSKAVPEIEDTPVERYWRSRGIELKELKHLERRWVRFRPDMPFPHLPGSPLYPAMVAGFTDAGGVMRALHTTYLKADGSGKAALPKAKLMFGPMKGCMIRLAKGESGLDPEAAAAASIAEPVVICEGIEDGLSLAMMDPDLRVWAAGSLSNYLEIFDHPCVSAFMVARDNDWGKAEPARLFDRAIEKLKRFGKPVRVVRSSIGKDFNDQLRNAA